MTESTPASGEASAPPGVIEALQRLQADGRAGVHATAETVHMLGRLLAADLALARAAVLRALVCLALMIVFGGSAWLLLMAALVALLHWVGLSWLGALLLAALLSLAVTMLAFWAARRYLAHGGLQTSRRQLRRLVQDALTVLDALRTAAPPPQTPDAAAGPAQEAQS